MGALSGSLTYELYFPEEEPPENWRNFFTERINLEAFEPLDPEEDEDESIGWVHLERPLQTQFEPKDIHFDEYLNLGFRRDRYSIPTALLDAHVEEAERDYKTEHDKETLKKHEREEIEQMVEQKLRKETLPKMRLVDFSWDLSSNRVRFWSHANKLNELFRELFEETFGIQLLPASPYVNGLQLDLAPDRIERLQRIEPTDFTDRD